MHIPWTPRSKKVLELSLREALALKHKHIGTEHILLGLIREGQGLAAKILADRGLDLKQLRDKTIEASKEEVKPGAVIGPGPRFWRGLVLRTCALGSGGHGAHDPPDEQAIR